jgi:hypothetical protein
VVYATKDALQGDPAPERVFEFPEAETNVSPAERKAREAYAAELDAQADAIGEPDISRTRRMVAQRVRDALPVLEFFSRLGKIQQAKADRMELSGLEGVHLRAGLEESEQALRDENPYPPVLLDMVQRFVDFGPGKVRPADYLRGATSESDRLSVAAAVSLLGLDTAEKSARKRKQPITKAELEARVAKAVKAELARLDAQTRAMQRELEDYKSEVSAQYKVRWND